MERLRRNASFKEAFIYMLQCAFVIFVMSYVLGEIGELMK